MTRDELILHARTWVGTPYHHQGRSRHGVDCIGFPVALLRELDLLPANFNDYRSYGRHPDGQMEPIVRSYCEPASRAAPGCLLLIKWPQEKFASHAAICTGPTMIHSYARAGEVVEHGFRGPWVKNFAGAWKLPGVEYE